ncbi:hypothetical protein GCM10022225_11570 [Plantactinospora mayteni]|uniref:UGSC-like domain-containing protein n=2 Tax=Plantactinospora mayteni TaxID=566021 RepID=A0ABQ4EH73_9ACTN|nr:hypothetical protein Pma05_06640 [Plantactinospora mayteni]
MTDWAGVILDPTGDADRGADTTLAPRLGSLRGATLGLLDNGKPNGSVLLGEIGDHLRDRYGVREVVMYTKSYFGTPVDQTLTERIVQECDFAIAAIGD